MIAKQCKDTREFLRRNNISCFKSDKTDRLVFSKNEEIRRRLSEVLNDKDTYEEKKKSNNKTLEKQANTLMKSALSQSEIISDKSQMHKLMTYGTKPAKFFGFIKDHKSKSDGTYPLRPNASVHDTPVDKIDWIISKVLTQLLNFVPSHLDSTETLIKDLKKIINK